MSRHDSPKDEPESRSSSRRVVLSTMKRVGRSSQNSRATSLHSTPLQSVKSPRGSNTNDNIEHFMLFPVIVSIQCKPLFLSTRLVHEEALFARHFNKKSRKYSQIKNWVKYFDVVRSNFSSVLVCSQRSSVVFNSNNEIVYLRGTDFPLRGLPNLLTILPTARENGELFGKSDSEASTNHDGQGKCDINHVRPRRDRSNSVDQPLDAMAKELFTVRAKNRLRTVQLECSYNLNPNSWTKEQECRTSTSQDFETTQHITCQNTCEWNSDSTAMSEYVSATAISSCGKYYGFVTIQGDIRVFDFTRSSSSIEHQVGCTVHGAQPLPTAMSIYYQDSTNEVLVAVGYINMTLKVFSFAEHVVDQLEDTEDTPLMRISIEEVEPEDEVSTKPTTTDTSTPLTWKEIRHFRIVGKEVVDLLSNNTAKRTHRHRPKSLSHDMEGVSHLDWISSLIFFDSDRLIIGTEEGRIAMVQLLSLSLHQPSMEDLFMTPDEDQPSLKPGTPLEVSTEGISCISCSPMGRKVITSSFDGLLRVYRVDLELESSISLSLILTGHKGSVCCVTLSANGCLAYSGGYDKTVIVWDTVMGKPLRTIRDLENYVPRWMPHGETADRDHWVVRRISLSEDQYLLSVVLQGGAVIFFDASVPEQVFSTGLGLFDLDSNSKDDDQEERRVTSIAISDRYMDAGPGESVLLDKILNSNYIAVVGTSSSLAIYDLRSECLIFDISFEKSQFKYGTDEGFVIEQITNGLACFTSVTPDGKCLAFSYSSVVSVVKDLVVDPHSLCEIMLTDCSYLMGHDLSPFGVVDITCLSISADGSVVIVGDQNGQLLILNSLSMQLLAGFDAHSHDIRGIAMSYNQLMIATGGTDCAVRLWRCRESRASFRRIDDSMFQDEDTGKDMWEWNVIGRHKEPINDMVFSGDDSVLFTAGEDRSVILWDTKRHCRLAVLKRHSSGVRCIGVCKALPILIVGCKNKEAVIWNWKTGEKLRILRNGMVNSKYRCHKGRVTAVGISSDGSMLITGTDNGAGYLNFHLESVCEDFTRVAHCMQRKQQRKSKYSLSALHCVLPLCPRLALTGLFEDIVLGNVNSSPFGPYFERRLDVEDDTTRSNISFLREFVLAQWFFDNKDKSNNDMTDESNSYGGEDILLRLSASKHLLVVEHLLAAVPHMVLVPISHAFSTSVSASTTFKNNLHGSSSLLRHLVHISQLLAADLRSMKIKIDSQVLKLIMDVHLLFWCPFNTRDRSDTLSSEFFKMSLQDWNYSCRHSFEPFLGNDSIAYLKHDKHLAETSCIQDICDVAFKWPYLFLDVVKQLKIVENYDFTVSENAETQLFLDSYVLKGSSARCQTNFWVEEESQLLLERAHSIISSVFGLRKTMKSIIPLPVTPFVIPLKGIGSKDSKFLTTLVDSCKKTRDFSAFDNSVVRLVVEYKWNMFVSLRYLRNFIFHCIWFSTFLASSISFHHFQSLAHDDPERIGHDIIFLIVFAFCVYFIVHEISQLIPSFPDLIRARANGVQLGLIEWGLKPTLSYFSDFDHCLSFSSTAMVVSTWMVQAGIMLRDPDASNLDYSHRIHRAMAAATLPLLVVNLLYSLGGFRSSGIFVRKLVAIMRGIVTLILLLFLVLIAFSGSFMLLMPNQVAFSTYRSSLMAVYTVLFSSFDPEDMFAAAVFPSLAVALLALFLFIANIVLLNLLIAIMYDIQQRTESSIEAETTFAQAKIVVEYERSLVNVTTDLRDEIDNIVRNSNWKWSQFLGRHDSTDNLSTYFPMMGFFYGKWLWIANAFFFDVINNQNEKLFFPDWIHILAKSDCELFERSETTGISTQRVDGLSYSLFDFVTNDDGEAEVSRSQKDSDNMWINMNNAKTERLWKTPM